MCTGVPNSAKKSVIYISSKNTIVYFFISPLFIGMNCDKALLTSCSAGPGNRLYIGYWIFSIRLS
jgi:hypothetical protein